MFDCNINFELFNVFKRNSDVDFNISDQHKLSNVKCTVSFN